MSFVLNFDIGILVRKIKFKNLPSYSIIICISLSLGVNLMRLLPQTNMADSSSKAIWFTVKRLDLNENEAKEMISINIKEDDKISDVTQNLNSKLQLNSSDLILRARNDKGSLIPLNGKIALLSNSNIRPFTLEVVRHFQSVQPKPNSLELTQYADSLKSKLFDIQERITDVEISMENMHERRKEKIHQEIAKLDNTVSFLKKRLEESETIEWRDRIYVEPVPELRGNLEKALAKIPNSNGLWVALSEFPLCARLCAQVPPEKVGHVVRDKLFPSFLLTPATTKLGEHPYYFFFIFFSL
ncbi:hypothetical protein Btru_062585 [Bulinus truncatus]|nr:hypothetical protein Btru_062585 [Bulinus truncatus]